MPEFMIDLGRLSFAAVKELAKAEASGGMEDWAQGVCDMSTLGRAMAPGAGDYFLTVRKVPALCVRMGTPLIIQWMSARYDFLLAQEDRPPLAPLDEAAAIKLIGDLARESGQVCDALAKGLADGEIGPEDLPGVRKELRDVGALVLRAQAAIEALERFWTQDQNTGGKL